MERINKLTKLRGSLSQQEVADAVGISRCYYSQIENGLTPSLETAIRIASFFGVPVESIWTGVRDQEPGRTTRTARDETCAASA